MLLAIIASLLLGTGPKAFLMALALPLGQSAISLAIGKLWGKVAEGPRTKPKTKRKPFARSSSNFRKQEKEERSSDGRARSGGYQSWASADSGVADRVGDSRRSSFGGWDELDSQIGSMRRESSTTTGGSPQTEMPRRSKLSKRGRYRDAPLFFRLLIAVFPFLGSWTKIL